jgi:uncharacterized membrane protein YGL010W
MSKYLNLHTEYYKTYKVNKINIKLHQLFVVCKYLWKTQVLYSQKLTIFQLYGLRTAIKNAFPLAEPWSDKSFILG